ncbi:MAG: alpha/beta hydrolase [Geodermatophilaceae bacterium]|nr:alpha/beta hydrolase [Geodermatophilaceae bacterium]
MQIPVGELTFEVTVVGAEEGRPVLLLHGFPETGRSWDAVRESLVRSGHRVIVPDQRGYSPGARPTEVAAFGNDADQQERSAYIRLFWIQGKAERVLLEDDAKRLRTMLAGLSEDAVDHYVSVLSEPGALRATLNWYRAMSRQDGTDLPPITVPTTYVWSTKDMAIGQAAAQKCGEFVDAAYRFVILDGVSHWIPEHAADQLTAAILDQMAST